MAVGGESLRLTIRVTGDLARYIAALQPGQRAVWARDALQEAMEREIASETAAYPHDLLERQLDNQRQMITLLHELPDAIAQSFVAAIAAGGLTAELPNRQPEKGLNSNEKVESAAKWQPQQQPKNWQPAEWQSKQLPNDSQSSEIDAGAAKRQPLDIPENADGMPENDEVAAKQLPDWQPEDRGSQAGSYSKPLAAAQDRGAKPAHIRVSGQALERMARAWRHSQPHSSPEGGSRGV